MSNEPNEVFTTALNEDEELFTGRFVQTLVPNREPNETHRVPPVDSVWLQQHDPRQNDFFSGVFQTFYESPTMLPRSFTAGIVGQSALFAMAGLGFSSFLSGLLNSTGISNIEQHIASLNHTPKDSYTYSEYKSLMGGRPNLRPSENPLGLNTAGIFPAINFVTQVAQNLGQTETEARPRAEQEAERFDSIRQQTHNLIGEVESFEEEHIRTFDMMYRASTNSDHTLLNMNQRWATMFNSNQVIQPGNFRDQIVDISNFLSSYNAHIISMNSRGELAEEVWNYFSDNIEPNTVRFRNDFMNIVRNNFDYTLALQDEVTTLDPRRGEFRPNGLLQNVNLTIPRRLANMNNRVFENLRSNYLDPCHNSVSQLYTDYSSPTHNARDVVENAAGEIPNDLEVANPGPGSGDRELESQVGDFPEYTDSVGPLDEGQFQQFRDQLAEWESNSDYSAENGGGYLGKYQFGAMALQDIDLVKPGSSNNKTLNNASRWTGKWGVNSKEDFLGDGEAQEKAFVAWQRVQYKYLKNHNIVNENSSPRHVAGYLAAAHLVGNEGAAILYNGRGDPRDSNGVPASQYRDGMMAAITNDDNPSYEYQRRVWQNTIPDGATYSQPSGTAAPKSVYNKVYEYEGGHFKEYDSTPGNERIHEKHKTGTGYEVSSDGNLSTVVIKDNYTAVLGNDSLQVSGNANIVAKGDVGIRAYGMLNIMGGEQLNINSAGNLTLNVGGKLAFNAQNGVSFRTQGDMALNAGGFMELGVGTNFVLDAGSINGTARNTEVNFGAATDMNLYAENDIKEVASNDVFIHAHRNQHATAGNNYRAAADNTAAIGAQSTTTVHSDSKVELNSEGAMHFVSEDKIRVWPLIDRAEWATMADQAPIGISIEPPPTADADDAQTISISANGKQESHIDMTREPISEGKWHADAQFDGTHGWAGGMNHTDKFYKGGIKNND